MSPSTCLNIISVVSPALYQALVNHNKALKSLKREYKKHADREQQLGDILGSLRTGYNPNYQDMAVLEAVRGWEELAGLPHINDIKKGEEATTEESTTPTEETPEDDGLWTKDELDLELDDILQTDYTQLLLDHEEHINAPTGDSLRKYKDLNNSAIVTNLPPQSSRSRLIFRIPCSLNTKLSRILFLSGWKDSVLFLKRQQARPVSVRHMFLCFFSDLDVPAESSRAQQNLATATSELNRIKSEKAEAESTITKIFHPEHFGLEGEWKKLDDDCLEHEYGELVYLFPRE